MKILHWESIVLLYPVVLVSLAACKIMIPSASSKSFWNASYIHFHSLILYLCDVGGFFLQKVRRLLSLLTFLMTFCIFLHCMLYTLVPFCTLHAWCWIYFLQEVGYSLLTFLHIPILLYVLSLAVLWCWIHFL